jgi:hypothetical protein
VSTAEAGSSSSSNSVKIAASAPIKAGKPTKTAGTPAKLAHYDTPKVFYPRGGNSECLWDITYSSPVVVVPGTNQIGVATATW